MTFQNCDLHTHSTASDGGLPPAELWQRAVDNGVDLLALTDHDTVAGCRELLALPELKTGLTLVPGVEISALHERRAIHVLGLWVDPHSQGLLGFLERQSELRSERAQRIDQRLQRAGIVGTLARAEELAAGAPVSRPHLARALVQGGHCRDEKAAFKRWLGKGKIGEISCEWPVLEKVIAVIHDAGGVAVLAHPDKYKLTRTRLKQLLGDFATAGGDAIELVSGRQNAEVTQKLIAMTRELGLAGSVGSDFHQPMPHHCDVGEARQLAADVPAVWALPTVVKKLENAGSHLGAGI